MTLSRTLSGPRTAPASGRLFLSLLERIRSGTWCSSRPTVSSACSAIRTRRPGARLELRDWRACGAILRKGDIGFADAWRAFWVDTPDLAALLRVAIRNERALQRTVYGGWLAQLWYGLRHRLTPQYALRQPAQYPRALRHRQRVLRALAGPEFHLFERGVRRQFPSIARRRAAREISTHHRYARLARGHAHSGNRLRVGRLCDARGAPGHSCARRDDLACAARIRAAACERSRPQPIASSSNCATTVR